jgi:hypothetical protein
MRKAWLDSPSSLKERLAKPAQVVSVSPEAEMPPYMESFLAHLRLLVGVPFDYLIPDSRLLPPESIRFFYLDRSWTDRLVDGAINVGKIGTREQAHHQAHHAGVRQQVDLTERLVRKLQVAGASHGPLLDLAEARRVAQSRGAAEVITGFLLRSSAVSGWPHMDVRAFDRVLPEGIEAAGEEATNSQLLTLRLERLSPSVLLALFQGVPRLVWCEEPHHGIQFGVNELGGQFFAVRRDREGNLIRNRDDIQVPVRSANRQVIAVKDLRDTMKKTRQDELNAGLNPTMVEQNGSANFAVSILNRPWRQRFQGQGGPRACFQGSGAYAPSILVAPRVSIEELQSLLLEVTQ